LPEDTLAEIRRIREIARDFEVRTAG
jgi:hypothetical protein